MTFSILTAAPHWEPFSIPVLFPFIAMQAGKTSDRRPTIEFSIIFTSALRQSMKRGVGGGGVSGCFTASVGNC